MPTASSVCGRPEPRIKPGLCLPWEEKAKQLPDTSGDPDMIRRVWEEIEGLGDTFIGNSC